jgi:hypothetical protein
VHVLFQEVARIATAPRAGEMDGSQPVITVPEIAVQEMGPECC